MESVLRWSGNVKVPSIEMIQFFGERPGLRCVNTTALSGGGIAEPAAPQEGVDLVAGDRPVVVEIGDDIAHETFREADGALSVAEVIKQYREGQLLRALPFVGPFETIFGEALDLIVLVELLAVDGDHEAIDRALSLVRLHVTPTRLHA
jgi:hypothetical protein